MIALPLSLAGLYLLVCLLAWRFQDRLIYFPARELAATPAKAGLAYEEVLLRADDGARLAAWWIPHPQARGAVLFFHGNAGNRSHRLETYQFLHGLGLSVLAPDYRGYGGSEGRPREARIYADARTAWRHLVEERGLPPSRLLIFGRSLGGAVAAELAEAGAAAGLVVESSFSSAADLGARAYPWLPVRLLLRERYPAAERLAASALPKLVIHSPDDEVAPFVLGQALFERAAPPKRLEVIRGGHNEGWLRSRARYAEIWRRFLDETLPASG